MNIDIETMTFEKAFAMLSETLEKLEVGDLPLEEAIVLYEQGMALAKHCNVQLDAAELRIKQLTPSGELELFDED
ncbi:MAG: exodeoxyribonuclease VII small subunit [Aliifodinibius sp.]|nr:exodeoxyribonuclease VII small subunit [Fodinibius sp.]NIV10138.1 exodeoxyribonuclease VII small subunit [Fodinibius sp.]NIY23764.1 exodeoxyribonuclease VII small subunit [Fodinibius sp.]